MIDVGEVERECRRLRPSLDIYPNNAILMCALERAVRQVDWEASHYLDYRVDGRSVKKVPMSVVSKSWYTDAGRFHIRGMLYARGVKLIEFGKQSGEVFKHLVLTFRDVEQSWNAQNALRHFLTVLHTKLKRMGYSIRYMWVAELQNRGALHYHMILAGCPRLDLEWLRREWPYGYIWLSVIDGERGIGYLMKYIRKATREDSLQSDVQQVLHSAAGMRRYGCSRAVSAKDGTERVPAWVSLGCEAAGWLLESVDWVRIGEFGYLTRGEVEVRVVDLARDGWVLCMGYGELGGVSDKR